MQKSCSWAGAAESVPRLGGVTNENLEFGDPESPKTSTKNDYKMIRAPASIGSRGILWGIPWGILWEALGIPRATLGTAPKHTFSTMLSDILFRRVQNRPMHQKTKRAVYLPRFGPLGLRIRPGGVLGMPDRFPVFLLNTDSQNKEFLMFLALVKTLTFHNV